MKVALLADTQTTIYGLVDPRGPRTVAACRYVGRAVDPEKRLNAHCAPSSLRVHCRRASWIKSLRASGLRPACIVLETCDRSAEGEREAFWVAAATAIGADLTNDAPAGLGGSFPGGKRPLRTRRLIAARLRGNKNGLGVVRSPEVTERTALANFHHGMKRAGVTPSLVRRVFAAKGKMTARQAAEKFNRLSDWVYAVWTGRRYSRITGVV